jgi:hypothetical protein
MLEDAQETRAFFILKCQSKVFPVGLEVVFVTSGC